MSVLNIIHKESLCGNFPSLDKSSVHHLRFHVHKAKQHFKDHIDEPRVVKKKRRAPISDPHYKSSPPDKTFGGEILTAEPILTETIEVEMSSPDEYSSSVQSLDQDIILDEDDMSTV